MPQIRKRLSSFDHALRDLVAYTSASRYSTPKDFIEGVLLITPDSLCFDALRTAIAQKRAYLHAHRSSRTSSLDAHDQSVAEPLICTPKVTSTDDPPAKTVDSAENDIASGSHSPPISPSAADNVPQIPKELLELGLCIPLDLFASMSTLRFLPASNLNEHNTKQWTLTGTGTLDNHFAKICLSVWTLGHLRRRDKEEVTEHIPVWLKKAMEDKLEIVTSSTERKRLIYRIAQHPFEQKHCITPAHAFQVIYNATNAK
ncbi:unnamed protein product [Echinostoma caproni]|uniref:Uncharacterized protein n=1 Tax=Echinostoma caproni TaxID=27848 RepID=A0A183B325_9TREM|nr:unnamed protein product [Echinostoma caproni]